MNDKLFDFSNTDIAFFEVSTVITILFVLSRLFLKFRVLLWKGTLISYIVFVIFMLLAQVYQHSSFAEMPLFAIPYRTLGAILVVPGMLIYGLIPGKVKMCPTDSDEFWIYTCAFLFYAIVFWGIMKLIKKNKEPKAIEQKQDDNVGKQTPTETDA
jgi:hypothetical protein